MGIPRSGASIPDLLSPFRAKFGDRSQEQGESLCQAWSSGVAQHYSVLIASQTAPRTLGRHLCSRMRQAAAPGSQRRVRVPAGGGIGSKASGDLNKQLPR